MPRQVVFTCPSCGASLSVDEGARTTQCQFCGSTVAVPNALGGQGAPVGAPYSAPNVGSGAAGPGPAVPYYVPMMSPVIPDTNKVFRGIMGLNIAITLAVFAFTACIVVFVFLAIGLAFVPALFAGLGPLFSR